MAKVGSRLCKISNAKRLLLLLLLPNCNHVSDDLDDLGKCLHNEIDQVVNGKATFSFF